MRVISLKLKPRVFHSLSHWEINSFASKRRWIIHVIMPAFGLTHYEVNNYTRHGFTMQHFQFATNNFIYVQELPFSVFVSNYKRKTALAVLQETPTPSYTLIVEILISETIFLFVLVDTKSI